MNHNAMVWIGAFVLALVSGVAFLFINFQTVASAQSDKSDVISRLVRLEDKSDKLGDKIETILERVKK